MDRTFTSPAVKDEPDLTSRLDALAGEFARIYGSQPEAYVRSPGRAEILGNHTDYNKGYAIACALPQSTVALLRGRRDGQFAFYSTLRSAASNTSGGAPPGPDVRFTADGLSGLTHVKGYWGNYPAAVAKELASVGALPGGADVLIDSRVPDSGGVSSSAALELAIALGLSSLAGKQLEKMEAAQLCKQAENGPLVQSPCGFLDQGSVAFGQSGKFVLFDFDPPGGRDPAAVRLIEGDLARHGVTLVIAVDRTVKRELGESGYPERRKMCEASLGVLGPLLGRKLDSLRQVSVEEFEKNRSELERRGKESNRATMRMRVEHIVYENRRVLDGVRALEAGDMAEFGRLLDASGRSALDLYQLDDGTEELTFLVDAGRASRYSMGTRNMGGGFSAVTLSLVRQSDLPAFENEVQESYGRRWGRPLHFIEFRPAQGAEVL